MIPFLKLIRYKNLLMVLLTMVLTKYALLPYFLAGSYLSIIDFTILTTSALLITATGYVINDIYDIDLDKINKPSNIYIGLTISRKNAWISYILLTILVVFIFDFLPEKSNSIFDYPVYYIIFVYMSFASLSNLIREILKDIEDIDGDYSENMKTLPIILEVIRGQEIL